MFSGHGSLLTTDCIFEMGTTVLVVKLLWGQWTQRPLLLLQITQNERMFMRKRGYFSLVLFL